MNKKIFLTAFACLAFGAIFAQDVVVKESVEYSSDKFKVETNGFWDNWFIGIAGGAQVYYGDHDNRCDFVDRIAPAAEIAVGKWITPGFGVRFMYSGLQAKGATQNGAHSTGDAVPGKGGHGFWLTEQKFDMGNLHADFMLNCSNLFFGYNEKRIWNCSPYFGIGWARVYDSPSSKEVAANIGINNSFRLSAAFDANIDIRGMYAADRFDGEDGGKFSEGMWSLTAGITYKFKKRGWDRSKTVTRNLYDNTAINDLRRQLNDMVAENGRLKDALANCEKSSERVVVMRPAANIVTFKINKSKLTNEARVNLGFMAESIKSGDPNAVYTITGHADKGTGSAKTNERLSRERAEAVYKCLVEEFGVNEKQLRIDYKGGVENMFYDDPRLSRAVITRCAE